MKKTGIKKKRRRKRQSKSVSEFLKEHPGGFSAGIYPEWERK
jgi:hypothetical protein